LTPGFEQTTLAEGGFFQSVILSFDAEPVMVPVSEFFSMAKATYGTAGACEGQDGDVPTSLNFSNELGAGENSPPVDTVVVVGGRSIVPAKQEGAELNIACMMDMVDELALAFDSLGGDLIADGSTTADIKVLLRNGENSAAVDVEGWQYGVAFDAEKLEFVSGAPGADAQALKGGAGPDFASYQAEMSADGSLMGVTVGVVIELDGPGNPSMMIAAGSTNHIDTITVKSASVLEGDPEQTEVSFSGALGGGEDRDPIEILFVSGGDSLIPDTSGADALLTVNLVPPTGGDEICDNGEDDDGDGDVDCDDADCAADPNCQPPVEGLALSFDNAGLDLPADQSSTVELKVLLLSGDNVDPTDVQGWSYGVALDDAELAFDSGAPGADSAALNGGAGPDFATYDASMSADGSVVGVTVGVVIDLDGPGDSVLSVGPGASLHLDSISLRSAQSIPEDGAARSTTVSFTGALGDLGERDPIEILLVVDGLGVAVTADATADVNLQPADGGDLALFIRSDANNDGRPDLADGIYLINEMFYNGPAAPCPAASDANSDGSQDLTDAMFIFQYWLQPNATPGNLLPAPAAPFPACGTAEGITAAECPASDCSS